MFSETLLKCLGWVTLRRVMYHMMIGTRNEYRVYGDKVWRRNMTRRDRIKKVVSCGNGAINHELFSAFYFKLCIVLCTVRPCISGIPTYTVHIQFSIIYWKLFRGHIVTESASTFSHLNQISRESWNISPRVDVCPGQHWEHKKIILGAQYVWTETGQKLKARIYNAENITENFYVSVLRYLIIS